MRTPVPAADGPPVAESSKGSSDRELRGVPFTKAPIASGGPLSRPRHVPDGPLLTPSGWAGGLRSPHCSGCHPCCQVALAVTVQEVPSRSWPPPVFSGVPADSPTYLLVLEPGEFPKRPLSAWKVSVCRLVSEASFRTWASSLAPPFPTHSLLGPNVTIRSWAPPDERTRHPVPGLGAAPGGWGRWCRAGERLAPSGPGWK